MTTADDLHDQIDLQKLPVHIAVIMDGNGRWAKQRGHDRVFGHQHGVEAVRQTAEAAAELGVKYLTLYAFSTENWNRPKAEVDALMSLLVHTIHGELKTLNDNNIRLRAIGDLKSMSSEVLARLNEAIADTAGNNRMDLVLALSYSGRWEISEAVRSIANEVKEGNLQPEDVDEAIISSYMNAPDIPDPELMIRTSGECRISNYYLWQLAYSELYFTNVLWPDFRKNDLYEAIIDYQKRERRFGQTSEQLTNNEE
jgi:undecaprenyl diphosphate synthase